MPALMSHLLWTYRMLMPASMASTMIMIINGSRCFHCPVSMVPLFKTFLSSWECHQCCRIVSCGVLKLLILPSRLVHSCHINPVAHPVVLQPLRYLLDYHITTLPDATAYFMTLIISESYPNTIFPSYDRRRCTKT